MIKTLSFYTAILTMGLTLLNQQASASDGHNHKSSNGWQADADLVYRSESHPNTLGFLTTNQHEKTAGLKLEHFDLSYQSDLSKLTTNKDVKNASGKVSISYHSNNFEITEVWLKNKWLKNRWFSALEFKAGKYLPRIGFLNHQHEHHYAFQQAPLINRVYWGDQISEAGAELSYTLGNKNVSLLQTFNVLGGSHLNSKQDTLAYLYQAEGSLNYDQVSLVVLGSYYQTTVEDRGLVLFNLNNTTHTHSNSQFNEYFDGDIQHTTAGLKLVYRSTIGIWQLQSEYVQRNEEGRLYNTTTNLANLDLQSNGMYQQITWQSPNQTYQAGVRYNYLYSDAIVTNTSDNSLDNSRLNNQDQTPQMVSLLLGYQLSDNQKLKIIASDNIEWKEYSQRFEIHYQQSLRF